MNGSASNSQIATSQRSFVKSSDEMRMVYGPRIVTVSEGELTGNWGADGLRRALENLITNAVKFGASGTPVTDQLGVGDAAIESDSAE